MYEDAYLDSYWEDLYELPDDHDEWDEWEKDRLCEDRALEEDDYYDDLDDADLDDDCYDSDEEDYDSDEDLGRDLP